MIVYTKFALCITGDMRVSNRRNIPRGGFKGARGGGTSDEGAAV